MDALAAVPLKWLFEHCVFDESSLELRVHGVLVELERKPLEVLRHLLRHAGEIVTKEELHTAVWPGRIVSETVLAKAISRIREVLADDAQTLIKTVHGYGYRLIAPVRVESAASVPTPVLGLRAGESPPLRPQWRLEQHLDRGGSGEVWKVVHRKTGDVRVCKFAVDAEALNTLKREITLFRLLRQQLGADAPIAEILDWNLEEAPYFLESPYYVTGNLSQWAQSQGGLMQMSLKQRLAVFADIAGAVGQVHGVGVLHKDLKADNILMRIEGDVIKPLLADFGGGGVLAEGVIENAGITRMGFTEQLNNGAQASALYLAPEVIEGQPQTLRGDIYSLGVLLYQLCVGDFRKPISPGWEQGIEDALLRADIADAVQGDPDRRLSSAQVLSDRIRELESRRAKCAAEAADSERRQHAERAVARFRQRRSWMLAIIAALSIGLGLAGVQYCNAVSERNRAEAAAKIALDSGRFMIESLLPGYDAGVQTGTRNMSVRDLLDSASRAADAKLATQPEIAFHVRIALANAYNQIEGGAVEAKRQERLSHHALRAVMAADPRRALQLIPTEGLWIAGPEDRILVNELLALAEAQPELDPAVQLGILGSNSDAEFRYGSLQKARRYAEKAQILAEQVGDDASIEDNLAFLIRIAREDADFTEAERLTPYYERIVQRGQPPSPLNLAYFRADRGITRLLRGDVAAAAADLEQGYLEVLALQPDSNWYSRYVTAYFIALKADQRDYEAVRSLAQQWSDIATSIAPDEPDMPGEMLAVAEACWKSHEHKLAEQLLLKLEAMQTPGHRQSIANWARLDMALMRAEARDAAGARKWLSRIQPSGWADYRGGHPRRAIEAEAWGLLAQLEGRMSDAQPLLREAEIMLSASYGEGHWRLRQLRQQLDLRAR